LLAQRLNSRETHALQEKVTGALHQYDNSIGRLQESLKANEFDEAMKLLDGEVAKNYETIETDLTALSHFVFNLSAHNGRETQAILDRNLRTTLMLSAVIATLALLAIGLV